MILYPGRKFEFFGPPFYNLVDLTMALRCAKYAIIAGYSFKDPHIAKIFDLATRENKDLILFLISPSACNIYKKIRIKRLFFLIDRLVYIYTYISRDLY